MTVLNTDGYKVNINSTRNNFNRVRFLASQFKVVWCRPLKHPHKQHNPCPQSSLVQRYELVQAHEVKKEKSRDQEKKEKLNSFDFIKYEKH